MSYKFQVASRASYKTRYLLGDWIKLTTVRGILSLRNSKDLIRWPLCSSTLVNALSK